MNLGQNWQRNWVMANNVVKEVELYAEMTVWLDTYLKDKYKGNKPDAKPLLRKNYAMGLGDVPQPMWLRHAYIYIKDWGQGAHGDSKP